MRWASRLFRQAVRSARPHTRKPSRLRVESLEPREVPAVAGTAYIDLNLNGAQDPEDVGVAGVTVTATTAAGATETATTKDNGSYSLSTDADVVRLVFSDLPANALPGRVTESSGPLVRFLDKDADRSAVDLALAAPQLATTQFFYDDALTGANSAEAAVSAVPYGAPDGSVPTVLATVADVGSVWGLAYHPASNSLYASSFVKRHAGLGPNADASGTTTGGIYKIDPLGNNPPELLIDLNTAGAGLGAGADPHPKTAEADDGDWFHDAATLGAVGKRGLGGLAVSPDGRTLYTVNLNTRELVEIPLAADGTRDTTRTIRHTDIPLANPLGSAIANFNANDVRPFAVAARGNAVFVGVTYTAETSGVASDLRAYVYAFDPSTGTFRSYNQATGAFTAAALSPVLGANLSYPRGLADDPTPGEPGDEVRATWKAWISSFATNVGQEGFPVHPEPWLTDIAFDGTTMVLGVRDRFGDQGGYQTGNTAAGSEDEFSVIAAGDILRAAPSGLGWSMEFNGSAGGVTTAGAGNGQGNGGGEFYFQDNADPTPDEVATGGLAQVPGFRTIAATGNNPGDPFSGGLFTFFNTNSGKGGDAAGAAGTVDAKTTVYSTFDLNTFGSANGLGDVAALAADGTVQVGDRVFADANGNGVQDANEAGIGGVVVQLFQGDTAADSVTTGAGGDFLFDGLKPNTAYQLRIDTTQAALKDRTLAPANAGGNDLLDSDAVAAGTTATVVFTTGDAGTSDHSLDVGFAGAGTTAPTLTLGDRVFRDDNRNGHLDDFEHGIPGVTVELLNEAGTTVLNTTTTAADGTYRFTGLAAGTYRVRLAGANLTGTGVLVGFDPSPVPAAADPNDNVDGDNNGATTGTPPGPFPIVTGPINLAAGAEPTNDGDADANTNLTVDFGLSPRTGALLLGGTLFADANRDGQLGTGESGIGGATVELLNPGGTVMATTIAAANGDYSFANLAPGDYRARLAAANFNPGGPLAGRTPSPSAVANPNNDVDNDSNGTASGTLGSGGFVVTGPITLAQASEPSFGIDGDGPDGNKTLDFGLVTPAATPTLTLGNLVFRDNNANGTFDAGDVGITGVAVELLNEAGTTVLNATTTGAGGTYQFTGLAAGTYRVRLAAANFNTGNLLAGFTPSAAAVANADNNADNDSNGTTTGTLGTSGFVVTGPVTLAVGAEPATTADPAGNTNQTVDFGLVAPAATTGNLSVGGQVWTDVNNNGLLDTGESGPSGVSVQLVNAAGTVLQSTTTGVNGGYTFAGLAVGDYKVRLAATNFTGTNPLFGFTSSTGANGAATGGFEGSSTPDPDTNADNDDNGQVSGTLGGTGFIESGLISLAAGAEPTADGDGADGNQTVDLGVFRKLSLGNTVFNDANNNGTQDASETGVPNVTVRLLDAANGNAVVATTTTDAQGQYLFTNLVAGSYVAELAAANFNAGGALFNFKSSAGTGSAFEPAPAGATDKQDHGSTTGTLGSGGSVRSGAIALSAAGPTGETPNTDPNTPDAQANLTADFGVFQQAGTTARISGQVFLDFNNNGDDNTTDAGIAGVTMTLSGGGLAAPITVQTDASGTFRFNNLAAGTYTLTETQPTSPANQSGKTTAGTGGGTVGTNTVTGITVTAGQQASGYNFAEVPLLSTGGFVYEDKNGNGTKEATEPGIAGVTVTLTGSSVVGGAITPKTATTGTDGAYTFSNLTPGTYAIAESQPGAFTDGKEQNGTPAATVASDKFLGINLTTTATSGGFNFGEVKGTGIAGFVFSDANNDGAKAATGEPGIAGAKVRLVGTNDQHQAVDKTVTTGADGGYSFGGLRPGTYRLLEVGQPVGFRDGKEAAGSASGVATTKEQITGIQLASGTQATGYLFAEQPAADLRMAQSPAAATINPGGTVTITYTLRNRGSAAAPAASVLMNFGGLTFVSASAPAEFNATTKTWTVGNLAADATKTIRLTFRATAAGTYATSAQASTTATELATGNNRSASTIAVGVPTPTPDPTPVPGSAAVFRSRMWFLSSITNAFRRGRR